jgi:hypothetical protein
VEDSSDGVEKTVRLISIFTSCYYNVVNDLRAEDGQTKGGYR